MKERRTASTSSFILHPSESGGGAIRTHRGKTARRLSGPLHDHLCVASSKSDECGMMSAELKTASYSSLCTPTSALLKRKVWESNPQERLSSDSFRDCAACQVPNLPLVWQGRPDSNRDWRIWSSPVWPLTYAPSSNASGRIRTSMPHQGLRLYRPLPNHFGL